MAKKSIPVVSAAVLGMALALGPFAHVAALPQVQNANTQVISATKFQNCTALNRVYPHGVAKKGARDKVSGKSRPVTNFKVDNALYAANSRMDRDKDGVACEKR